MIPGPFAYQRADSVATAVAALGSDGDEAKLLAGGMSLIPILKMRLAEPAKLIDIGGIEDLRYVRSDGDFVRIGALTRHSDLIADATIRRDLPLLSMVAGEVGDAQVRARGTIGGVLAHADSAGDYCTVAAMLDASIVTTQRTIPASEFFLDFMTTPLEYAEIVTEVVFPKQSHRFSYLKFRRRRSDWAIVGVAVQASDAGYRVGLTNVRSVVCRSEACEAALAAGATAAEAAAVAAQHSEPSGDDPDAVEYKTALVRVLTERALLEVEAA